VSAVLTTNGLRGALKERGWSHARLAAELRKHAKGSTLPKTESLNALISRWVNNDQQPDDFYRDLLARALGRPRAELFSDEGMRMELPVDAQPWRLARALEAASIGQAGVAALEHTVGEFARSYPSTPPTVLAGPVFEHFRDVVRLLEGPLPVTRRRRLAVVAGHLAGLAGNLSFDLREQTRALAYFEVAVQAADDAGAPDLAAWALATRSIVPPTPATRQLPCGYSRRRRTAPPATSAQAGAPGWPPWRPGARRPRRRPQQPCRSRPGRGRH
jgi:hypothetical protein